MIRASRQNRGKAGKSPPLYEVRELTLEEALLVLAAEKEERREAEERQAEEARARGRRRAGGRGPDRS